MGRVAVLVILLALLAPLGVLGGVACSGLRPAAAFAPDSPEVLALERAATWCAAHGATAEELLEVRDLLAAGAWVPAAQRLAAVVERARAVGVEVPPEVLGPIVRAIAAGRAGARE
jgi:hypothetical protein